MLFGNKWMSRLIDLLINSSCNHPKTVSAAALEDRIVPKLSTTIVARERALGLKTKLDFGLKQKRRHEANHTNTHKSLMSHRAIRWKNCMKKKKESDETSDTTDEHLKPYKLQNPLTKHRRTSKRKRKRKMSLLY